ncbi:MAG: AraC family transcriptional regulator [Spirochaetes bacterium]|nr:AraC family transcriptional regulator [Spirochaetota bacterium]
MKAGTKNKNIHAVSPRIFSPGAHELAPFPHLFMFGMHKRSAATRGLQAHYNPGIEICYVLEGEFEWTVEGRHVRIRPGEASLTLPWQLHGGRENVIGRGHLAWVIIKPKRFIKNGTLTLGGWSGIDRETAKELGMIFTRMPSAHIGRVERMDAVFLDMYRELSAPMIGSAARVNALIDELLLICARQVSCSKTDAASFTQAHEVPPQIDAILRVMREEPGKDWALTALAHDAGLKTTAFSAWVKRVTGFSPMEYVIRARIEKAKTLLADRRIPITDISFDLGFSSSQHFTNVFKKNTGTTPTGYRNAHASPATHADDRR